MLSFHRTQIAPNFEGLVAFGSEITWLASKQSNGHATEVPKFSKGANGHTNSTTTTTTTTAAVTTTTTITTATTNATNTTY